MDIGKVRQSASEGTRRGERALDHQPPTTRRASRNTTTSLGGSPSSVVKDHSRTTERSEGVSPTSAARRERPFDPYGLEQPPLRVSKTTTESDQTTRSFITPHQVTGRYPQPTVTTLDSSQLAAHTHPRKSQKIRGFVVGGEGWGPPTGRGRGVGARSDPTGTGRGILVGYNSCTVQLSGSGHRGHRGTGVEHHRHRPRCRARPRPPATGHRARVLRGRPPASAPRAWPRPCFPTALLGGHAGHGVGLDRWPCRVGSVLARVIAAP